MIALNQSGSVSKMQPVKNYLKKLTCENKNQQEAIMKKKNKKSNQGNISKNGYQAKIKKENIGKTKKMFLKLVEKLKNESGRKKINYPSAITVFVGPPSSGKTTIANKLLEECENLEIISLRKLARAENFEKKSFDIEQFLGKILDAIFSDDQIKSKKILFPALNSISCARFLHEIQLYCDDIFYKEFSSHDNSSIAATEEHKGTFISKLKLNIFFLKVEPDVCFQRMNNNKLIQEKISQDKYLKFCKGICKKNDTVIKFLGENYEINGINANKDLNFVYQQIANLFHESSSEMIQEHSTAVVIQNSIQNEIENIFRSKTWAL